MWYVASVSETGGRKEKEEITGVRKKERYGRQPKKVGLSTAEGLTRHGKPIFRKTSCKSAEVKHNDGVVFTCLRREQPVLLSNFASSWVAINLTLFSFSACPSLARKERWWEDLVVAETWQRNRPIRTHFQFSVFLYALVALQVCLTSSKQSNFRLLFNTASLFTSTFSSF